MAGPVSDSAHGAAAAAEDTAPEHLSAEALAHALHAVDWSAASCKRLGRIMARRDVDLATALCVFFRGAPERFNYLPKPHVPDGYRAVARQLDNICLRINSGFYLPLPERPLACRAELDRWLAYQRADRQEGRCGRWVLDEATLAPLLEAAGERAPPPVRKPGRHGRWQALRALLCDLRGARAVMRGRK